MREGIQTFLAEAGEAACYALCIIEIAERATGLKMEPSKALYLGVDEKYIIYNFENKEDNNNFYVKDPAGFLSRLTGQKWTVEYIPSEYPTGKTFDGLPEYIVERWERNKTGQTIGHFRLFDWDSLTDSQTVKYGAIASKRRFRRV